MSDIDLGLDDFETEDADEELEEDVEEDAEEAVEETGTRIPSNTELIAELRGRTDITTPKSPLPAIRQHCVETCCCGQITEVKLCAADGIRSKLCPLYPFRLGRNPFRTPRKLSPEQREVMATRLARARSNKTANVGTKESK